MVAVDRHRRRHVPAAIAAWRTRLPRPAALSASTAGMPGSPPTSRRNRIISGLARGVLVVGSSGAIRFVDHRQDGAEQGAYLRSPVPIHRVRNATS